MRVPAPSHTLTVATVSPLPPSVATVPPLPVAVEPPLPVPDEPPLPLAVEPPLPEVVLPPEPLPLPPVPVLVPGVPVPVEQAAMAAKLARNDETSARFRILKCRIFAPGEGDNSRLVTVVSP